MKKLLIAGLVILLQGCISRAPDQAGYAPQAADTAVQSRARIHAELAAGYLELGSLGVALQEANEALKADPNYVSAYNVLGLAYMELNDDRAAERSFAARCRSTVWTPIPTITMAGFYASASVRKSRLNTFSMPCVIRSIQRRKSRG